VTKGTITARKTGQLHARQARHRLNKSSGKKTMPTPNGRVFQDWKKTWMTVGEVPPKKLIEGLSPWASASIIGTRVLPIDSSRWAIQSPGFPHGVAWMPGPASVR
jgi:hypothetical protein